MIQNIHRVNKKGALIVQCDPEQQIIQASLGAGQIVPVNAYAYTPAWRWPMVGEKWILKEENGSWFLDILQEPQTPTAEEESD